MADEGVLRVVCASGRDGRSGCFYYRDILHRPRSTAVQIQQQCRSGPFEQRGQIPGTKLRESPRIRIGNTALAGGVQINSAQERLILIVEDYEDDAFFVQRAFEKAAVENPLQFVPTGREAITYLNGDPPYADREKYPLPSLVLLDVTMPLMDGFEVLEWVRSQPRFANLRVVVLTGSEEKRAESYELGADAFMVKPLDSVGAAELSRSIECPIVTN